MTDNPVKQLIENGLSRKRITQKHLAELLGVSTSTLSDWKTGKKTPRGPNLRALEEALDLKLEQFTPTPTPSATSEAPRAVMVPLVGFGSAGPGYDNGDFPEQSAVVVDPIETYRNTGHNAERLRAITIVGDSLAPEIAPNTRVLYLPLPGFIGDGLYVVNMDGTEIVKRIQILPGGALELIPINPDYHTELLLPVQDQDASDYGNLYRSSRTNLTATVRCVGKVVQYSKAA